MGQCVPNDKRPTLIEILQLTLKRVSKYFIECWSSEFFFIRIFSQITTIWLNVMLYRDSWSRYVSTRGKAGLDGFPDKKGSYFQKIYWTYCQYGQIGPVKLWISHKQSLDWRGFTVIRESNIIKLVSINTLIHSN